MHSYKRLAIALIVPLLMTVVARRAQFAATPAELQRGAGQGGRGQAAPAQPNQEPPARGARGGRGAGAGTPGPATELLRLMAVGKTHPRVHGVPTVVRTGKPRYGIHD